MRLSRTAGLAAALLLGASAALAGSSESESSRLLRNAADAGGDARPASANSKLNSAAGEEVMGRFSSSANNRLFPGAMHIFSFPGRVEDLAERGDIATSSLTLTWTTPGYDGSAGSLQPGTSYYIRLASFTVPDTFSPSFANIVISTDGAAPGLAVSSSVAGLLPNTTYYSQLWTRDMAGNQSYSSPRATMTTLAKPPGLEAPSILAVHFTSATLQWAGLPVSPPAASSDSASGYRLEASSTNFGELFPGGIVHSSTTYDVRVTTLTIVDEPTSLFVDTTYYFRVASLNKAGAAHYIVLGSSKTKFQISDPLPGSPTYPAVSSFSVTAQWDPGGNPAQTSYNVQASTAQDFTGTADLSSTTLQWSRELFLLQTNTTYYFRVNATTRSTTSGWADLGSTATLAAFPAAAAQSFSSVYAASMTVDWLRGDNPAAVSSYTVVLSTGDSYPNEFTGNVALATVPAGGFPAATVEGLDPNTTYFAFVDAQNWLGASSGFTALGSTVTRASPPLSAAFSAVRSSSLTVTWSHNGNPVGITTYTVVLSTGLSYPNSFTGNVSLSTAPLAAAATLEGLELNTTYHLFIEAVNHAADSTGFRTFGSTATLAAQPGQPAGPAFTDMTSTGLRLNWDTNSNAAGTTYYAQASLVPSFTTSAGSSKTLNTHADFTGLAVNTTYYYRAAAYSHHHGTWTVYTDFGSTATLADIPATAVTTFTAVHFTSATVRWTVNGNPLNVTTYTVVMSPQTPYPNEHPDNVVFSTAPAGASPLGTVVTGLNSGTTYYLFVAAVNHNGLETDYAALGSTRTRLSPKTWAGGCGNNSWHSAACWSPAGVPSYTDAVTINSAVNVTALASNPAISFSSLTVGSPAGTYRASLTISTGVLRAGSVLIHSNAGLLLGSTQLYTFTGDFTMLKGSSMTHTWNSTTGLLSKIDIKVTGDFNLQGGATITATAAGYNGGAANGGNGEGPGPGQGSAALSGGGSGAGHGGLGGDGGGLPGGSPYDDAEDPAEAGSGGGGGDAAQGGPGGRGGGLVRIEAVTAYLDGLILSSGTAGGNGPGGQTARAAGGGGSGGGVKVKAAVFFGTGTVTATGGDGGADTDGGNDPGGGGAGGRVALHATVAGSVCDMSVSTAGGASGGVGASAGGGGSFDSLSSYEAPAGFSGVDVTSHSISWQWSLSQSGKNYQVMASTGGAVSPVLGPTETTYSEYGLLANTTYSRYVRVTGCGASADSSAAELATLTRIPDAISSPALAAFSSSITVRWGAYPDSPEPESGEGYRLEASSTNFGVLFPGGVTESSTTYSRYASTLTVQDLLPNTTYFFRVHGLSHSGSTGPYSALGSTPSLGAVPSPALDSFLAVFQSSMSVAWSRNGNPVDVTTYTVVLSTGASYPNSFSGNVSLSTAPPGASPRATLSGLAVNAVYFLYARSVNHAGLPSAYAALGSSPTLAALPGPSLEYPAFTDPDLSSLRVHWSSGTDSPGHNPEGTLFYAQVSVDQSFASVAGASETYNLHADFPGLDANTTYYARAAAFSLNTGTWTAYAELGSSATLAGAPGTLDPAFLSVYFTSATAQWQRMPSAPPSATAEGYRLEASSTNFGALSPGGIVHSSTTYDVNVNTLTIVDVPEPLLSATTYYFRVRSLNWNGVAGPYTVLGFTKTRLQVNQPGLDPPTYVAVSSFGITPRWSANGNPSGTVYTLAASTAADFTGDADLSSTTFSLSHHLFRLGRNTTYYFQVKAATEADTSAWRDLGSTVTLAALPAAAAQTFSRVYASSMTLSWSTGGNPATVSTYTVVLSTGDSYPNDFTGNVVLSTQPAGGSPAATASGLEPNTTYFAYADAQNWIGASSGYVSLGSTATRASPPLSGAFTAVRHSSLTVSWDHNGNPVGITTYTVVLSTGLSYPNSYTGNVSLSTAPGAAAATLEGLVLNTTYQLFIEALNHAADSTGFRAFGSTATLAAQPGQPAGPAFTDMTSAGLRLNWDTNSNAAGTTYYAQASLVPSFTTSAGSSKTLNTHADFTGLAANTTYYFRTAAYSHHHGTWTVYTDLSSTATLANIPATALSTFSAVHLTSMTVRWTNNGNPLNITTYTVVLSPQTPYPNEDPDNVVFSTAPAGASPLAAAVTGLNSGTTYYLFVAAVNHNGLETDYAALGSTRTRLSPKTWAGGCGNNSWHSAACWSPAGVPSYTDAVTINSAVNVTALASNPAISFSSLTVGSPAGTYRASLTISTGVLRAGSVLIHSNAGLLLGSTQLYTFTGDFTMLKGSSMTHTQNAATGLISKIDIQVTGTFNLQGGATIAVTGMGYNGGAANGGDGQGPGPGNGDLNSSGGGSGAGHGGYGGQSAAGPGGSPYSSATDPYDAGSGGGGGDDASGGAGGRGGGLVRIEAVTAYLDGLILSSGTAGVYGGAASTTRGAGGGGSGGGVKVKAEVFTGTGTVIATGGDGGTDVNNGDDPGGGGAGGRVSLQATSYGTVCDVNVSTSGGASGGGTAYPGDGGSFSSTSTFQPPGGFTGVNVASYSITWQWSLSPAGKYYQVMASTGGPVSSLLGPAVTSYDEYGLLANTTYSRYVRVSGCGNSSDSSAAELATLTSTQAAVSPPALAAFTSSITVRWAACPASPEAVSCEGYRLEASSTNFGALLPGGVTESSTTYSRAASTLTVQTPLSNTTWYFRVFGLNHAGSTGPYTALGSTSTLAPAPVRLAEDFLAVHFTSVTAQWAALPSGAAEGYLVAASSTDFGALLPGGVVYSSSTPDVLVSTLTVWQPPGMDACKPHYFRLASLNWNGAPNYVAVGSTQNLRYEVLVSTHELTIGSVNMDTEIVISTSYIVTNMACPATFRIMAATVTAGSPWVISTTSGTDTFTLQAVFNAVEPALADFEDIDKLTDAPADSTAARFAMGQTGVSVPYTGTRLLWFKLGLPRVTSTLADQTIRVTVFAVSP